MPVSKVLSALAEPIRLQAIGIIWDGGAHCVCELMERLDATIASFGIASTPGIVIDGQVVDAGGLPKQDAIENWLRA